MSRYLLDTNHASRLVTLDHPFREKVLLRRHNHDVFVLCPPVVLEVSFGISGLPQAERNKAEWQRLLPLFESITLDIEDAGFAATLRLLLRRQGYTLGAMDGLIGSLALRHDLILLSTDKDFDAIPELVREDWVTSIADPPDGPTLGQ